MKIKSIKLSDGHAPKEGHDAAADEATWRKAQRFRVEQLTESIEFHTGQFLERSEVEALCMSKYWKVTIVSFK